jgi:hypothetical protein
VVGVPLADEAARDAAVAKTEADAEARMAEARAERDAAAAQARADADSKSAAPKPNATRSGRRQPTPRPPQRPKPSGYGPTPPRCSPGPAPMPPANERKCAPMSVPALSAEQRTHAYRDELTQLRTADPDPVAAEALRHWARVPAGQLRAS